MIIFNCLIVQKGKVKERRKEMKKRREEVEEVVFSWRMPGT